MTARRSSMRRASSRSVRSSACSRRSAIRSRARRGEAMSATTPNDPLEALIQTHIVARDAAQAIGEHLINFEEYTAATEPFHSAVRNLGLEIGELRRRPTLYEVLAAVRTVEVK